MDDIIVNKVAQSGLVSLDLEKFYHGGERVLLDIKDQLFMGMILKEKDFREWIKAFDWNAFAGKNVAITCSADAIIPTWAYMLIASKLAGVAHHFVFGSMETLETSLFQQALGHLDLEEYRDKRVVIKGCGDKAVPESAYVEVTRILHPIAKSIMFGEPCSTVPVFKR